MTFEGPTKIDTHRYLIITVSESTKDVCQWYYTKLTYQEPKEGGLSLDLSKLEVIKLIDNFDAVYDYITNEGLLPHFVDICSIANRVSI